ncbi:unnamed protein product [Symbiodinium sp. CCMP2456]|nr:unnamed protein product [Symbiodinium sp. CCMP2456]
MDVACCYQWAWDADPLKKRMDKRQAFWRKLTTFAQGLPARNIKCIAGDFNCALKAQSRHIGPGLHPTAFTYPDSADFVQAITSANLCALNTWGPAKDAFTYLLDGQVPKRSQIDFVFTSLPHTDVQAKRSRANRDINFAPWRGGGHHFALIASLRVDTRLAPAGPAATQRPLPFSRQLLREAIKCKDPVLDQLAQEVHYELGTVRPTDPAELNNILLRRCAALFPLQQAHARFQSAHRELRKRGLAKRKAAILEELEAAEAAATAGDMHKLYFHELLKALKMQRGGRAIPPGSAPPELWKHLASTIAPHALPLINHRLGAGPLTTRSESASPEPSKRAPRPKS